MKAVFEFKDYKEYLHEVDDSGKYRAFRSLLAEAAHCQNAYISQVLNGSQHLSLEQADGIAEFFSFSLEEKSYFILLIQHARASKPSLKKFFADQIQTTVEKYLSLRSRVNTGESLSESDQITYYSEWFYSAIHVIVTIGKFRSTEAISQRLNLPLATVKKASEFLISCGLLAQKKGEITTGQKRLYLPGDSPLISRHHTNWRLHSIYSLSHATIGDLHYSSVVTVSTEDAETIREILIKAVQKTKNVVRSSSEEDIFSFSVDFYKI